jgi:ABC-type antimicrobial peptide transport system permease subunit
MKPNRFFSILLGIGIAMSSVGVVSAADLIEADESFAMPNDAIPGQHGVVFTDQDTGQIASYLTDRAKFSNDQIDPTCSSLDDKSCTSNLLDFRAIIPFCQGSTDMNCIEEVGAVKEDGSKVVGEFKQYFPLKAQNEFAGNPDYQLPSGTSGSIFSLPNLSHKGGDLYFASFEMTGFVEKSNKRSTTTGFSARITPRPTSECTANNGNLRRNQHCLP